MYQCRDAYDCVIIGAGPAGSVTGMELARGGRSVLLVDAATFPRSKVCGCCINLAAWSVLKRLGLSDRLHRAGAVPLGSFELANRRRRAVLAHDVGYALSRARLDFELAEACREVGATFLPGTRATVLPRATAAYRVVKLAGPHSVHFVRAQVVVAANGLSDTLGIGSRDGRSVIGRSKIGAGAATAALPPAYAQGRIFMATHDAGYVGLVAVEEGRFDIAAAFDPAAVKAASGLGPLAAQVLESAGLPSVPGIETLNWRGTPGLTHRPQWVARNRVYRVGDAAGYVEPFTGQGIAWAVAGAVALAEILNAPGALDDADRCEAEWSQRYVQRVVQRQIACGVLSRALRLPLARSGLVFSIAMAPRLARRVISRLQAS